MSRQQFFDGAYGSKPPENYERFFVPAIGEPLAHDLIHLAALRPGERLLDVGCGTGIVARLASQQVGPDGTVAGLDANPGMLAIARSVTPEDVSIEWYESSAEEMPLPDEAFDVVLCQISLQFMMNKLAALREMRRVLVPGGRIVLNVPGPAGNVFAVLAEAMDRHIGSQAAAFVNQVFSLHETTEVQKLLAEAGFSNIAVQTDHKVLILPQASQFLWQYVHSTPLATMVANVNDRVRSALESDVVKKWQSSEKDGSLIYRQRIVEASARK